MIFAHLTINLFSIDKKPNFIRIGETNPSVTAFVLGSGEQLSGQQFQTDGIKTYKGYQYTVYYNQTRNVCIARRKLPSGKWQEIKLPYQNTANDAHNTISMGICHKDGSIHLSYDHHNSPLHYCYSIESAGSTNDPDNMIWNVNTFSATTNVMDKAVPNVTYPRFITKPDGNLLFECRYRWSGYGDSYLREYDGITKKWSLIGRYVQGEDVTPDACAYINGMSYDHLGRLHVTWCWRDDFGGGTNHDFYYAYSEDNGRTWKDTNNEHKASTDIMSPPGDDVADKNTGSCLGQTKKSFMVEAIPYNKGYINQETQAVDSKGRIHAVNSQIPGTETDSNWGSSRTKARLHHRFRDIDGTWKKILVKNNGVTVNSYCRVNLSFDAFDNAFVVANGAEIYYATDANGYEDWNLLSDVDKGRFVSEPLVDRSLLKEEGVLSFVYLGSDNKITVIDYLLDNPNTPSGAGLSVEYFSDNNFTTLINAVNNVNVSSSSFPINTKSVRWSGAFETKFAEKYTLYLTTTAETTVFVDGVKVLLTRKNSTPKEYSFTFNPIASHKHNIVIESKAEKTDEFTLSWSSSSETKKSIPNSALYSEKAHQISAGGEIENPVFDKKSELKDLLLNLQNITNKKTINITPFNPQGDYTLEIKAKIISSNDCGLVLEGRSANGKGFRILLDETSLKWNVPYSQADLLTVADNSEYQTYRLVVNSSNAYIYHGEEFISSVALSEIGDINESGVETATTPEVTELGLQWAGPGNTGAGKPNEYGWENSIDITAWNTANSGSGVRFLDITTSSNPVHNYNSSPYTGRILTIRWDGTYGTYSFPVTLEANSSYEFSMYYEWWNNGSPTSISVGISQTKNTSDITEIKSFPVAAKNVLQKATFTFKSKQAGTYYLIFNGQSGVMYGISNLALKKLSYQPKLSISKYCEGASDIIINYVKYEDGKYAPGHEFNETDLEKKDILPQLVAENIQINGTNGAKNIHILPFDLTNNYSVEIATTVSSSVGRGLDIEVRDRGGNGFRTALNNSEFTWIAPFNQAENLSVSNVDEQIIRYAVKDNKVFVFKNGVFVKSQSTQFVGNMDETGTAEKFPYSNTSIENSSNKISNPDFQGTADNGAPAGWTSNGALGNSPNARVQQKSSTTELSSYPDGTKAFLIRFDGSYQWFSYPLILDADKWYEYSFDLITWGTNPDKTFNITVSTAQASGGDVITSQQVITPSVRATSKRTILRFKTNAAGTYYITYAKGGTLAGTAGITNLCLVEYPLNGMLLGKNYTEGNVNINIRYVKVDYEGAYAPNESPSSTPKSDDNNQDIITYVSNSKLMIHYEGEQELMSIEIVDLSGKRILNEKVSGKEYSKNLEKGFYIITIKTTDNKTFTKKTMVC
ncbi:hypothetical protein MASR2M117_11580 [Paludibacter sp.]